MLLVHKFFCWLTLYLIAESGADNIKRSTRIRVSENWVGSKIGTQDYNKELDVIQLGIDDFTRKVAKRANSSLSHKVKRSLLCATFIHATEKPSHVLRSNMLQMDGMCDWAVILYDGNDSAADRLCGSLQNNWVNIIHCRRFVRPRQVETDGDVYNGDSSAEAAVTSIPKTVLYTELLPYLPRFRRVFLMDEDISLAGFNYSTFKNVWDCAFYPSPPPLVVQPLIAESNQYLPFVNANRWTRGDRKDVYASGVGLVEQQVPFFDAPFFEWFVRHVLSLTYDLALSRGVDWGHDRSWCAAAAMYSSRVLGRGANDSVPCALLTRGTAVHHLNGHTMASKRMDREAFHRNAVVVVQRYIDLFPTWVVVDLLGGTNPLDAVHGTNYRISRSIDAQCLAAPR